MTEHCVENVDQYKVMMMVSCEIPYSPLYILYVGVLKPNDIGNETIETMLMANDANTNAVVESML